MDLQGNQSASTICLIVEAREMRLAEMSSSASGDQVMATPHAKERDSFFEETKPSWKENRNIFVETLAWMYFSIDFKLEILGMKRGIIPRAAHLRHRPCPAKRPLA